MVPSVRHSNEGKLPYLRVCFSRGRGKSPVHVSVNRLVCEAFHGAPGETGLHARHLNGDSLDNRAENLAWGTPVENAEDRQRHGRVARGAWCGSAKLTSAEVREIRELLERGEPMRAIARQFGVTGPTIRDIRDGRSWTWLD